MKNKGFTLVELLAVIAIIGILSIIIVPNVIDKYQDSVDNTMKIQETEVLDGAKLFVEDFCHNPISMGHKNLCSTYEHTGSGYVYFCVNDLQKQISISGFDSSPYLPSINYKGGVPCNGIVVFTKNGKSYSDGKSYLVCKNDSDNVIAYKTENSDTYNSALESCQVTTDEGNKPDIIKDPEIIINPLNDETTFSCECTSSPCKGDLNENNSIDIFDLRAMLGALIKQSGSSQSSFEGSMRGGYFDGYVKELSIEKLKISDVNNDNVLNTSDVSKVKSCVQDELTHSAVSDPENGLTVVIEQTETSFIESVIEKLGLTRILIGR